MTVLVTGARGAVGAGVLAGLRATGAAVRAAGRDPSALPDDLDRVRLDLGDPSSFAPALEGVERVFCYAAYDLAPFAAAARDAGVAHVVLLSSESVLTEPDPPPGSIPAYHADAETALRAAGLPTTALRPGAFAGNARQWLAGIDAGVVELPYPTAETTPIDERDIAAVAVAALTGDPVDVSPHLTGPESMSLADQVRLYAELRGREVEVRAVDPAVARARMAEFMPESVVDSLFAYWASTDGVAAPVTGEVERWTGRTPRTFREWVADSA